MKKIDLRESDHCEDMREAASSVGVQVVCNDEEDKAYERDISMSIPTKSEEGCENSKEVASSVGVQVVCDDEEDE